MNKEKTTSLDNIGKRQRWKDVHIIRRLNFCFNSNIMVETMLMKVDD